MKLKAPDAAAATARSPINWFPGICLAAFLTTTSASAVAPQTAARELNPAEKWVVAQVAAGEIADLSKQFPEEKDRKLSAHFLEVLLTGTRPDELHRHGVRIIGAIIDEPIDLENGQIQCQVGLADCQFHKSVTFSRASFADGVVFDKTAFKADASFDRMKVGGDALFHSAKFQNKEKAANFHNMKVGGAAFFYAAVFEGPVDFAGAKIAGRFTASGAQFQSKEKEAFFIEMKVGGGAGFDRAVFEGPVYFAGADIERNFAAEWAKFHNQVFFNSMKVRGNAFFNDAMFEGPVNLSYADFAWLDLSGVSWPKVAAQFDMQGMSYKYICAVRENEPESHKALLKLADQSAYSADVYSHLEEFFLRLGYRADADEAFIAGKCREREEYFRTGHWFRWLGSWTLDLLVGYGRRPWQAGVPCAVLVALGCVLFSPKKMEPQKPEDARRVYNRFWYSLDLFLPFVDLRADDVWKPKTNERFLRHYVRLHVMLGWILIPIVLAALTGLIK
jgi:uncharacterized protein YjbI with pentapeptide repeats